MAATTKKKAPFSGWSRRGGQNISDHRAFLTFDGASTPPLEEGNRSGLASFTPWAQRRSSSLILSCLSILQSLCHSFMRTIFQLRIPFQPSIQCFFRTEEVVHRSPTADKNYGTRWFSFHELPIFKIQSNPDCAVG